jgi:hypothetical protein
MGKNSAGAAIRQIGALYSLGTLGSLTDSQLLERYIEAKDETTRDKANLEDANPEVRYDAV